MFFFIEDTTKTTVITSETLVENTLYLRVKKLQLPRNTIVSKIKDNFRESIPVIIGKL